MGYYDYTGVANTCPKIDKVLDGLDSLAEFVSGYVDDEEDMEAIVKDVLQYKETLEEIRTMNQLLRDFGNEKAKEFDEMEKERDSYLVDKQELEEEKNSLEDKITDLEQRIDHLEEERDGLIDEVEEVRVENCYLKTGA